MALREKILRKAKEKAFVSLHELTTNQNSKTSTTLLNSPATAANTTKKNNRSYKPFPELNEQQQSDEEKSDTEYETPKKQTRTRRKTAAAAPGTADKEKTVRQTKQKAAAVVNEDELTIIQGDATTGSLFNQVFSGQVGMQTVVDDWIELYKKDKNMAMIDLIQFIVKSSGCRAVHMINNKELLRTKDFTECINDLIDNFNEDEDGPAAATGSSEIYPLIQNSTQARRFKSNFCEFIQLLINQCQYSIVYDQFMLDILITFLIALADSQVRAFRHTATLAVLKIMTALVDVLLSLSISKDACQRQYDNERQKSQLKRANDRIEMLLNKRKEVEDSEYEIQNFINFIFKAVFIHRYRDVCADIRCICINEIGEWMKKCPEKFLDDTFLKYIGWTFYDRIAECRLKCLQVLHPLYNQDELISKLELFSSRFKNRIVEMSLDKEHDVSVAAIKLLTKISSTHETFLEDKDCEKLYELVYHTHRPIAQAAGEFLNQKLFAKAENPQIEFRRGKKRSENSALLNLLVQFLIESELHDHPTYLVDAMWDTHKMLKDWECMTDLLLEDPINKDDALNDDNERYLIEIMNCCVKQAATGEYPVARRAHTNRKLTAKEMRQVEHDKTELTEHFITTLPDLITKFIADADKLVHLLEIASFFDLNQYTLCRQEKNLDRLLNLLQEIVNKHNDTNLLEECSKLLGYLCDEESSVCSKCDITRSAILDDLVAKFQAAMRALDQLTEIDENEMYPLQIALKRLSAFAQNHDITRYDDLIQYSFTILKWAHSNEGFEHELVNNALLLSRSVLTWNMTKLTQEVITFDVDEVLSEEQKKSLAEFKERVQSIAKMSKKYYKLCNQLLTNDDPLIGEAAYFELCDLLIMLSPKLKNVNKEYKPLVLECPTNDTNMLSVFVMNSSVFAQEALNEKPNTAENIEKLHNRRLILTSFCKLICFNCIPIKTSADIFRGYVKYNNIYGDIIKHLLSSCREISKINTAKTIALALQREYNEIVMNRLPNRDTSSDEREQVDFSTLKDLAHKFCLSFGPDAGVKSREAILAIHREAIEYANEPLSTSQQAPVNLPFLEAIIEFSSRLSAHDKKAILAELDKNFAKRANKLAHNNWQAYYSYRTSLMEDFHPININSASAKNQAAKNATTAVEPIDEEDPAQADDSPHGRKSSEAFEIQEGQVNDRDLAQTNQAKEVDARGSGLVVDKSKPSADFSNLSGISRLEKTKNATVVDEYDEENANEGDDANNSYTEAALNDLDTLKLSTINPPEINSRITRSTNVRTSQHLKPPLDRHHLSLRSNLLNKNKMLTSTANKRPRSPLADNNSINDSITERAQNILSSTRIDVNKGPVKTSIGITPINRDSEGGEGGPNAKRKKKSIEMDEGNENQEF